jgi:hypothetical protein
VMISALGSMAGLSTQARGVRAPTRRWARRWWPRRLVIAASVFIACIGPAI